MGEPDELLVPRMRAWSRWVTSRLFWIGWTFVGGVLGGFLPFTMITGDVANPVYLAMAAVFGVFVTAFVPQSIHVGRDGISFRWLGTERFYSYADVDRIERERTQQGEFHKRGWLVLRSGARVRLAPTFGSGAIANADGVYRALEYALAAFRKASTQPGSEVDLARAGRADGAWLARLKELAGSGDSFRGAAFDRDRLIASVENPALDPTERAAAAHLLRSGMSAQERTRVRVAAATSLTPRVRVALDAAAGEGDQEQSVRALTRVPPRRA